MAQTTDICCLGLRHLRMWWELEKPLCLTFRVREGEWWAEERRKHPSDLCFERGRGVEVGLEWAGGVKYEKALKKVDK